MSLQLDGDTGVTYNDGTLQSSAPVGRNRIINGDMKIDQRNAGASKTISNAIDTYYLDRYAAYTGTNADNTIQQVSTAPAGFINSTKIAKKIIS